MASNPKLNPILHDIILNGTGRSIIHKLYIFKHNITLVNIYEPNTDAPGAPSLKVL